MEYGQANNESFLSRKINLERTNTWFHSNDLPLIYPSSLLFYTKWFTHVCMFIIYIKICKILITAKKKTFCNFQASYLKDDYISTFFKMKNNDMITHSFSCFLKQTYCLWLSYLLSQRVQINLHDNNLSNSITFIKAILSYLS